MSKMLDFYKDILAAAGLIVTSDGCVSIQTSKDPKPLTMKGKRLVLPTKEHQANPDKEHRVLFHPLSENIMRGESEVFERFRSAINARLNIVIGSIMVQLLTLGTSQAEQHKLTPDQSEFLSKVKNADEKTLLALKKIMDSLSAAQHQKLFISTFIKRSGTVDDKRYSRVGVVSFPFYAELKKNETEVHGVKLRKKDIEALIGLLDYILPNQDVVGAYNRGSSSTIAPSLEALMFALRAVAGPLNDLVSRFDDIIPDNLLIAADWNEQLDNLDALLPEIRMLPMQAGNEGSVGAQDAAQTAPAAQGKLEPVTLNNPQLQQKQPMGWGTAPVQAQTSQESHVTPRGPSGGTNFEELIRQSPQLQQAVGIGSHRGWNQQSGWNQPYQAPRASLSSPNAAPPQQHWGNFGQQQQNWGNQQPQVRL